MYKIFAFIGLILVFILVAFYDSPKEIHQGTVTAIALEEREVEASMEEQNFLPPSDATLELVLEDVKEEGNYIIEVYREYEIYKDEDGNIIERIPTSKYNYLKYEQ